MANYLYNGVELPDIDSVWTDKETYPYAIVAKNDKYYLYLSAAKNYAKDITGFIGAGAYACFTYDIGGTASDWAVKDRGTLESDAGWAVAPFWSNHDIINQTDNSVFLAATEPVPASTTLYYTDIAYYLDGSVVGAHENTSETELSQPTSVSANGATVTVEFADGSSDSYTYDTEIAGVTYEAITSQDDTILFIRVYATTATDDDTDTDYDGVLDDGAEFEETYAVTSDALVATANAIRAKTGGTSRIEWKTDGFAEAVGQVATFITVASEDDLPSVAADGTIAVVEG